MLAIKGYILSKVSDIDKRNEINDIWKKQIQLLNDIDKNADQSFFQAWFRAHYAKTIRPGKAQAENQDFELIGTRFHNWFKDNHQELFNLESSSQFYEFFKDKFPFYVKCYVLYKNASNKLTEGLENIHYIKNWGIADSLQEPMILAPIYITDDSATINTKMNLTAKYIETFTVKRSLNYKKFGQTAIKYTMFNIIKTIRNNFVESLRSNYKKSSEEISYKFDAIKDFRLHGMNKKFIKHFLCRVSSYVDRLVGKDSSYTYYFSPKGKSFEIEHIWADKFDEHQQEFNQITDFQTWRNNIGALVLLPNGTNQSFNSDKYEDKLNHYIKENTYAQTLHKDYYVKNPNFLKSNEVKAIGFKPHNEFLKKDIIERNNIVQRICEQIWSF